MGLKWAYPYAGIYFISNTKSLKPLSHQSGVLTAFPQRLKKCRSPRCALCSRQQRCVRAVQSPRTPCGGVSFGYASNKRRGLAFAHGVRQRAVGTLWQRCGSSRAPWARCGRAACRLYRRRVNPAFDIIDILGVFRGDRTAR